MSAYHVVVWIDHREAHVLHFSRDEVAKELVHAHPQHRQTHHPSDGNLLKLARRYFAGADRMLAQPGSHQS